MTAERRLAALEATLTPTQLVLRWLDEAHTFGDVESYVRSLLDAEPGDLPLDRLCHEAERGARASQRSRRGDEVDRAIASALRQTVFRFELVMRINVTTHERLERQALLDAALSAQVALLTSEPREERRHDPTYRERLASRRDTLLTCVDELLAAEEARSLVEARYLDGHVALFPAMTTAWKERVRATQRLAVVTLGLAEHDGCPPPVESNPDAVSTRAAQLAADLVEPAKSTALEKLGEGRQALGIATNWLRGRLGSRIEGGRDGS